MTQTEKELLCQLLTHGRTFIFLLNSRNYKAATKLAKVLGSVVELQHESNDSSLFRLYAVKLLKVRL